MRFHESECVVLALATALWCALHSLTIGAAWTRYLQRRMGSHYRFYRLLFNFFALVTLVPLLILERRVDGPAFLAGNRIVGAGQVVLLLVAGLLFYLGAREYDLGAFLGFRQVREKQGRQTLTADGGLHVAGVLRWIRHPWYTGAMFILWSRPLNPATVVVNAVLTIYLVVGARLEERKLVAEFGEDYRRYQREVGMFFPAISSRQTDSTRR